MRQLLQIFIFMIFLISFYTLKGQEDYLANIEHFGIEEGLSHRTIFSIHEDKRGFIWIGTQYGLNRFDGHEFKWFT